VEDEAPLTPEEASHSSAQSSLQGTEDASMAASIHAALACLQLQVPQADLAQASAFFRRNPAPVPPSEGSLRELHAFGPLPLCCHAGSGDGGAGSLATH